VDLRRLSRPASFAVVAAAYLLAGAVAWLTVTLLPAWHPLIVALVADAATTLVVFGVSLAVDNASVYDPYWSVAPPVVAIGWSLVAAGTGTRQAFVVALIAVWAVRLTANWAYGWQGLHQEDWRYVRLRATRGRVPWWVVSLGGIQLMPTLVVFLGLLPVWPALAGGRPFGWLDLVATGVTAGSVALEASADRQLHRFARDPANRGRTIGSGVWALSRHPNYLGEIGFWWGLWLFALAADPSWWWTVVGPLVVVVLFATASIPMMDRRSLERRAGYAAHMRAVPALVPGPRQLCAALRRPGGAGRPGRDRPRS
jgi:steroid 5-alpha reductase family enzyme